MIEPIRKYDVSVVIPVYNSEPILPQLMERLQAFYGSRKETFETVFINDASTDSSWQKLQDIKKEYPDVTVINMLRNYGQHTAVFCGFRYAVGEFVITMDDDLQNPPEEITPLLGRIRKGYDAVFGKFREKKHSLFRRLGSKIIGYLNEKIFYKPKEITLTNFRIIRRSVIDRMLDYRTNYPYIPGLVLMFADTVANVEVEHKPRPVGKSNYGLVQIFKLVARLLFNYSSYPLKTLSVMGMTIALASFIAGAVYLVRGLVVGSAVPGWTSLVVLLSFLNGAILLILALIGEYLIRTLQQLSFKQSYVIKEIGRHE